MTPFCNPVLPDECWRKAVSSAVAGFIDGRNLPMAHGDRVMPVLGDVFDTTARLLEDAPAARARIDSLIDYLRELQY